MGVWEPSSRLDWMSTGKIRWNYSSKTDHQIGYFEKENPSKSWFVNQFGKKVFKFIETSITQNGTVNLFDPARHYRVKISNDGRAYGAKEGEEFKPILVGNSWS